jgi:hypothetical protein
MLNVQNLSPKENELLRREILELALGARQAGSGAENLVGPS